VFRQIAASSSVVDRDFFVSEDEPVGEEAENWKMKCDSRGSFRNSPQLLTLEIALAEP
jgi:hypothetical protein